ncbi:MAG: PHB depolymerase family esterase [Pseudomonadota bacterium]|nr:PHB depolymerase family esterase [Pseudomonadota bacterium]
MPDGIAQIAAGAFSGGSYTNGAGCRAYKLFAPHRYHGQALPLVVMLHGCTQDPDDFAAGTRMNQAADESDCFVLYPQQSKTANPSLCWNWFNALNQQRGHGEPSIIADMAREVIKTCGIDARQVFVVGMSAGGAMAVILAAAYPDLFSAVGVHSGIPYQAAQDLLTALSAMRRGAEDSALKNLKHVRAIVFHGSRDRKVHPRNGEQIILQLLGSSPASTTGQGVILQTGTKNGRSFQRKIFRHPDGRALAEQWLVKGTGHAWSGGSPEGSHVDPAGPDASREMLRFLLGSPDPVGTSGEAGAQKSLLRRALHALKLVPTQDP